ncbi:transcriptional regulator, LysR family [Arboricoccus pini]|uniref:Transcriptional regulator, LysR family n=1 Tax=Arboricoccus pini TaxID=1963835 RepID=A0A212RW62_9PROT|nr:LysR family transcriptional regulator [Arboricoccus pini]SNB76998.1 transcriptional regulator, LysR family [Arboricoccus pini]
MASLNQLKIFWTVANSPSLTKAAKQLGLSQPSLSQQVAKLEQSLGGKLFDRVNNQLILTDAGRYLVRRAEIILSEVDETEIEIAAFLNGGRGRIAVGSLASLARTVVPDAMRRLEALRPGIEIDLHELSPVEAVDQLYGRNLQIALLSSFSLAPNRNAFSKIELMEDQLVLAVPAHLDIDGVADPERDLSVEGRDLLNRTIQFNFGNQQNSRTEEWYRRVLPRHRTVAWCRSYESALAMVEAGLGVCLVPHMATQQNGRLLFDVRLYAVPGWVRPIVALVSPQYLRQEPFSLFVQALREAGKGCNPPALRACPPFVLDRTDQIAKNKS